MSVRPSPVVTPNLLNPVNVAHQQLSAKLSLINSLRSQKASSSITEEQTALQTLIDLRSTEAQVLLNAYVNAVNTFVGRVTTVSSS